MRKITTLFKNGIAAMMFMAVIPVSAQLVAPVPATDIEDAEDLNVGTITNNTGPVTPAPDAVLFYNPASDGPSLTLTASLDDSNGNDFDSYQWYNVTWDGSDDTEVAFSETGVTLSLSELEPGYHKIRVYGVVEDGSVLCQSDEFQDMILFVLPELEVATAFDDNDNPLAYCSSDAVPATPVQLSVSGITADYSTNTNGYTHPVGDDFAVSYAWHAVKDNDTENPIDLTTTATYDLDITDPGTYTFYVEVEYATAIKDKGSREYVTYTSTVQNGGANLEIVVTPTPGTPTISIGTVND